MSKIPSGHPDALGPVAEGPAVPSRRRRVRPEKESWTKPGVATVAIPSEQFTFNLKPREIARHLDRFVIGQTEAKKVLGVALCDHFQHVRMTQEGVDAPFYQKQNVLLLGPTGVGKTHLIRSAAELIGVPFVKADATKFSETGYVGGDVDDLVRDLVRKAGGNVKRAEHGIIYLDEVDKLATRGESGGRDVSGRGVQTNLLKLMEDGDVPVVSPNDMNAQIQNAMTAMRGNGSGQPETINTRHILFIVSGAFAGLDQRIRSRLLTSATSGAVDAPGSASKASRLSTDELLAEAMTSDFIQYGLEPEFVGRLPVRVACHGLDADDLFNVLRKSESSLIHQYERAFSAYGIEVGFTDAGLRSLARLAGQENTGARGLMTVCERVFRDLKFALPSSKVRRFEVTPELVADPRKALRELLKGGR
jgi:ATP-dependent Clp protease ATP-binding subunit ClpX